MSRRFAAQLALLPILWVLADASDSLFSLVVGLEIVLVWPVSLAVAGILSWLVREAEKGSKPTLHHVATELDREHPPVESSDPPIRCVQCAEPIRWIAGPAVPETLREAADNAVTTALIATGLAAAGGTAIARIAGIVIPGRPVLVLLGWALVLVGIPSISWLGTLRRVWIPMLGPTLDRFRR